MVMRPEPWGEALDASWRRTRRRRRVAAPDRPRPGGEPFTQALARELAARAWLVFACGRYEGIDQRVLDDARDPDAGVA